MIPLQATKNRVLIGNSLNQFTIKKQKAIKLKNLICNDAKKDTNNK